MITVNSREEFLLVLRTYLPNGSYGVELGVFDGDFSKQILDIINPKYLILIDPFRTIPERRYGNGLNELPTAYSTEENYHTVLKRFETEIAAGKISVCRRFSYDAVSYYNDNYFDFVYHDASHLYADVKKDLNDWLPKIKSTGIICGHDYIENYKLEVVAAVDEFCEEHNFEMIIFNSIGGDWALKRKQ